MVFGHLGPPISQAGARARLSVTDAWRIAAAGDLSIVRFPTVGVPTQEFRGKIFFEA
jgi:hypothetical protein